MLITLTAGPPPVVEAAAPGLAGDLAPARAPRQRRLRQLPHRATDDEVAAIYPAATRSGCRVKRRYDPENLFAGNHNIRPEEN